MQKLKTHLSRSQSSKFLPFKPGAGPYIAMHAWPTAGDFSLINFYPSGPFTCIFVLQETFFEFFLCRQNTQEMKRTLLNWMKLDKTCKFSRKPLLLSYVEHKTDKQLIQLILCQMAVGGWQKEKGTRLTCFGSFFFFRRLAVNPVSDLSLIHI